MPTQILVMLEDFHEPAPEGAELEAFLAQPKHHLARLIRDLFADEAAATTMEGGPVTCPHVTLLPLMPRTANMPINAHSSSAVLHLDGIDAGATTLPANESG